MSRCWQVRLQRHRASVHRGRQTPVLRTPASQQRGWTSRGLTAAAATALSPSPPRIFPPESTLKKLSRRPFAGAREPRSPGAFLTAGCAAHADGGGHQALPLIQKGEAGTPENRRVTRGARKRHTQKSVASAKRWFAVLPLLQPTGADGRREAMLGTKVDRHVAPSPAGPAARLAEGGRVWRAWCAQAKPGCFDRSQRGGDGA